MIISKLSSSLKAFKAVLENAKKAENFSLPPLRVRKSSNPHFIFLNRKMLKTNVAEIKKKNYTSLYKELPQILAKIFITFTSSDVGRAQLDQKIDTVIYQQEDSDSDLNSGQVLKAKDLQLSHREFLWRLADNAFSSLEKIQLISKNYLPEGTNDSFKKNILNIYGKILTHQGLGAGKSDRKADTEFLNQAGLILADTLDRFSPVNLKEGIKANFRAESRIRSLDTSKYSENDRQTNKLIDGLFAFMEIKGHEELDEDLVLEASGIESREVNTKELLAFAEKMRKVFNEYGYLYTTTVRDISDLLFSMLQQKPKEEISKTLKALKSAQQAKDLSKAKQAKNPQVKQL